MADTFQVRQFTVGTTTVILQVMNTLPLIISKADRLLREHVVRDFPGLPLDTKIVDEDMPDRFISMGCARSALTENIISLYYDKKYKDILVCPDFSYLTILTSSTPFNLTAYRLGSHTPLKDGDISSLLGMSEGDRFHLPEAKTGLKFKSYMLSITGAGTNNAIGADRFEELIKDVWNINHFSRRPSVLVELGTPAEIFTKPTPLHLYLLAQLNVVDFSTYYAGYMDYKDKLYLHFKF